MLIESDRIDGSFLPALAFTSTGTFDLQDDIVHFWIACELFISGYGPSCGANQYVQLPVLFFPQYVQFWENFDAEQKYDSLRDSHLILC